MHSLPEHQWFEGHQQQHKEKEDDIKYIRLWKWQLLKSICTCKSLNLLHNITVDGMAVWRNSSKMASVSLLCDTTLDLFFKLQVIKKSED